MSVLVENSRVHQPSYAGLRLSAEEYFSLRDDGQRYELIDGVVVMSPSPTPRHQLIAKVVLRQLDNYVERHGLGLVLYGTDVRLGKTPEGKDLVYRPEIVFIAADKAARVKGRIEVVPDVVVEVVSPDSRSLDAETKYNDYEGAGVGEYWLIDPIDEQTKFYRLIDGRYAVAPVGGSVYESEVVSGLKLDLTPIRAAFRRLG